VEGYRKVMLGMINDEDRRQFLARGDDPLKRKKIR